MLVSAAAAAGGLPYMANDSATKAYPLNLGEALHTELRQAGVNVTVLAPVLVDTAVVARIGLDAAPMPAAISAEQAVDEALTALVENRVTTLTTGRHGRGIRGHEGSRGRDDQGPARGGPARALKRSARHRQREPLAEPSRQGDLR